MIRQRVKLSLTRAVGSGTRLGRPTLDAPFEGNAQAELAKATGILKVAKKLGFGTGTVHRIKLAMTADAGRTFAPAD